MDSPVPAVLFGSISSLADTSELQREAFNRAFREHGLDWAWNSEDYRALLTGSGGQQRIADQARATGTDVDAGAVHATKSALFQKALVDNGIAPRAGVAETVRAAREQGLSVALVTTTSPENVAALLTGLGDALGVADFDLVVSSSQVSTPKPDGAVYTYALE